MTDWIPLIQLAGFAVTIATIIFYGGSLMQQLKHAIKEIDKVSDALFDENGIAEKVIRHEYHIEHVCARVNGRK